MLGEGLCLVVDTCTAAEQQSGELYHSLAEAMIRLSCRRGNGGALSAILTEEERQQQEQAAGAASLQPRTKLIGVVSLQVFISADLEGISGVMAGVQTSEDEIELHARYQHQDMRALFRVGQALPAPAAYVH